MTRRGTTARRALRAVGLVAATAALAGGLAASTPAGNPGGPNGPDVLATFAAGSFPESLALDGAGNPYVTLGFAGLVVRVMPDGTVTQVAELDVGNGLLTGLAFDDAGHLFVAAATFADDPAPGVFRLDPAGPVRVGTLPAESFPNGLVFHDGSLYVADSHGAVWLVDPAGITAASVWFQSPLIAPERFFGANGIAVREGQVLLAVSDAGRIVSVPIGPNGAAGTPVVVAERHELRSADGIAFDAAGALYVAVNASNRLYRLDPDGTLVRIADRSDGLAYPTMPAFGTDGTLLLTNGAYQNGVANLVAIDLP